MKTVLALAAMALSGCANNPWCKQPMQFGVMPQDRAGYSRPRLTFVPYGAHIATFYGEPTVTFADPRPSDTIPVQGR